MKNRFSELEKLLRQTAQARQDLKSKVAKLNAQRKDFSAEYAKAFIDPQIREAQADLKASHQAGFNRVCEILEGLSKSAMEKAAKLDLASPALSNALKVIELSGSSIDADTVRKINASFKGDQSALRMLRDVYQAHGVMYNGGLDAQIYDPESAFEHLGGYASQAFLREGSLNSLATAVSKVAAFEGIDFPKMIDEAGADDAMRAAAYIGQVAQ